MKHVLVMPDEMERTIRRHFFHNELEQGAFVFGRVEQTPSELRIVAADAYLVPPDGWEIQHEVFLQLKDAERAKIMKMARAGDFSLIDCHSHPDSGATVAFSPSDVTGITEFATYVNWKLGSKPYVAMVWGEASIDAVVWEGDFTRGQPLNELRIAGGSPNVLVPTGSWFRRPTPYWKGNQHGR